ncbi:MAG TPA: hypothetical protein VD837_10035 [Terriglobales bacterium]|nr:hypothetical protein [Terriglobales bacterium]
MSKNFELLERAQSLLQRTALFAATAASTPVNGREAPVFPRDQYGDEENIDIAGDQQSDVAGDQESTVMPKLPCAELSSAEKREFLKLVSGLFRPSDPKAPRAVAVAGVNDHSSSAHVVACTGELLAEQVPEAVCVIDLDFHSGDLHRHFGLARGEGFSEALKRPGSMRNYCKRIMGNLWVLSSGSSVDQDGLGRDRLHARLAELREEFGYCLLVVPPIGNSGETLFLGRMIDGVLLVLEANTTRRDSAVAAVEMLANAHVPVLGSVLKNRTFPIPQSVYEKL